MALATKPWDKYTSEQADEPAIDVPLTMREMVIILLNVPVGNTLDGYAVGWTIHGKLMRGVQSFVNRLDDQIVQKMMATPVTDGGQPRTG